MNVPIHELKAHLSHYLRMVAQGEHVVVTSHNRPLAAITPVSVKLVDARKKLLAAGGIEWDGKRPTGGGKRRPKVKGRRTVADLVLEDRE